MPDGIVTKNRSNMSIAAHSWLFAIDGRLIEYHYAAPHGDHTDSIEDLIILPPDPIRDERGYFSRTLDVEILAEGRHRGRRWLLRVQLDVAVTSC
jgi:hypothetical protein